MPRSGFTLLHNGQIHAPGGDMPGVDTLAIGGTDVVALGGFHELSERFPEADTIDLGGRVVVPGLIDGHIHAVRGGATWTRELHWERLRRREDAIQEIRRTAEITAPGTWIMAVGGWHGSQFGGWLPTPDELSAVAPDHPVYVQSLYEVGIANARAIAEIADVLSEIEGVERDVSGRPTGRVEGLAAFTAVAAAAGPSTPDQELDGTGALFSTLSSLGVTGLVDAGGFGMSADRYQAITRLHAERGLDVRVRMFFSAVTRGGELLDAEQNIVRLQQDPGDEYLRAIGIGEIVHFGCHDFEGLEDMQIAASTTEQLEQISVVAAVAGYPLHIHAVTDEVADLILSTWERVAATYPLRPLRFSIAHGDLLGRRSITRMAELGVGLILDGRQAFRAGASIDAWGEEAMTAVPPVGDLLGAGVRLGLGTDATRASSLNPWMALWWLVGGRPLNGFSQRGAANLVDRSVALDMMTAGNAWFTGEEGRRGTLRDGALADLAVLDRDLFSIDVDEIPEITSDLTLMGGRITHSSGAIAPTTARAREGH